MISCSRLSVGRSPFNESAKISEGAPFSFPRSSWLNQLIFPPFSVAVLNSTISRGQGKLPLSEVSLDRQKQPAYTFVHRKHLSYQTPVAKCLIYIGTEGRPVAAGASARSPGRRLDAAARVCEPDRQCPEVHPRPFPGVHRNRTQRYGGRTCHFRQGQRGRLRHAVRWQALRGFPAAP